MSMTMRARILGIVVTALCVAIPVGQAQILADVDYEIAQGYGTTNGAPIHGIDDAYGVASIQKVGGHAGTGFGENDYWQIDTNNVRSGAQSARLGPLPGPGEAATNIINKYTFNLPTRGNIAAAPGPIRISWSTYRSVLDDDLRMMAFGGLSDSQFTEVWQMRIRPDGQVDIEHAGVKDESSIANQTGWFDFEMILDLNLPTNQMLSAKVAPPDGSGFIEMLSAPQSFKTEPVISHYNRTWWYADGIVDAETRWDSFKLETDPVVAAGVTQSVANAATVTFQSRPGLRYDLESADRSNGVTFNWGPTGVGVLGDGGEMQLFDSTTGATNRVYRVVQR